MRLSILILLFASSVVWADDARERKVRVALALAAAQQCGECRFDEAGCRAEALRENKPIVLFVGAGCSQCGKVAQTAGAVACVTDKYEHDEFPASSPRAVILEPKPGGGFWRIDTLVNPTEATLKAALDKLKGPHSPAPTTVNAINWPF